MVHGQNMKNKGRMFSTRRRLTRREEFKLFLLAPIFIPHIALRAVWCFFVPVPVKKAWARAVFWFDILDVFLHRGGMVSSLGGMVEAAVVATALQQGKRS